MPTIAVLGGGISGLTTAYYLMKAGLDVTLFEKDRPGGILESTTHQGSVLDLGPNSLRDRTGLLQELIAELELDEQVITVSEASKTRCIVRNGKLQFLKPSLLAMLSTSLLSASGKLRMLSEPFRKAGPEEDESLASFLERRIGSEAVEYLIDPVFSGIYAGNIYTLSKREIMPELAAYEQEHGSLFNGVMSARKTKPKQTPLVFNFKKGIQSLSDRLAEKLGDHIRIETITGVQKQAKGYLISTNKEEYNFDQVVSCLPAFVLAELLGDTDQQLTKALNEVEYPAVLSTQLLFNTNKIDTPPSGFGFLVPRKENLRLLGAIWKTSIFPELTAEGHIQFNLLSGGAHDDLHKANIEEIETQVIQEFKNLMGITADPESIISKIWEQAIPQQNLGYEHLRSTINAFEAEYPGFQIGGNFRWGVAVPQCMEAAKDTAEKISHAQA